MFNCIKLDQSSFPFILLPVLGYHKLWQFPKESCFHFLKYHRLKAWKRKVMRQTKEGEHLHFYVKMHFRRLEKKVFWLVHTRAAYVVPLANMRECRCDDVLLLVLRALAWKGTGVHKHPSIFFPANLLHETAMYFSLWISQQTKAVVTAEETMRKSI